MKKILGIAASWILVIVSANAQSQKKEPPPPPPKPKNEVVKLTPPKIVKDEEEQVKAPPPPPPVVTVKGKMADDFYIRNPSVAEISRQGNIITLKKKDGTKEKYDMNKKQEDKSFTEKYGASTTPPPPPPPKKVS
jgi:hypothetical protein